MTTARRAPGRQQRQRDLDEAVEAELLEHAGMQHRGRAGRGAIAQRRPGVERPQRHENAEAEQQQAKDVLLPHLPASAPSASAVRRLMRSKLSTPLFW